jgi:hypothetical protein
MLLKIDDYNGSKKLLGRKRAEVNTKKRERRKESAAEKQCLMRPRSLGVDARSPLVRWHQSRLELPCMTPYSSKIQGLLSVWSNTRNADHSRICYREC